MAQMVPQRPAAVQAGVNAFLEKHRDELRHIHNLDFDEQEKELSVLMDKELARIAKMGPEETGKELSTSIMIALETDRILALNSERQQHVVTRKYGLDSKAIIEHYPEFQTQAVDLQKKLATADAYTSVMGWTGFIGTMATALTPFGKPQMNEAGKLKKLDLGDRFSSNNKLIKWFFVPFAAMAIGFASSFVGAQFFGRKVKKDSESLVVESRLALERELTDAVTYKVNDTIARLSSPVAPDTAGLVASLERKAPPEPRAGYVAEAAKEKAAAQAPGAAIG